MRYGGPRYAGYGRCNSVRAVKAERTTRGDNYCVPGARAGTSELDDHATAREPRPGDQSRKPAAQCDGLGGGVCDGGGGGAR